MNSKAIIVTAPENFINPEWVDHTAIFLAGSIDNGVAPDWQKEVLEALQDQNVMLMNPRRKDWDPKAGDDEVEKQVNWELDAMEHANYVIMYLAEGSKAPISLLELGLEAQSKRILVAAHPTYYRRVNVRVVCERNNIPLFETLEELIEAISDKIK
ncbi:MAG: nucleoside 2-deoxyribosyltransferase domain-containing protein [bacterium]|nr:nucleoside 2-deoxyribosyltransferase domain-containing protein [bacterium]